MREAKIYREYAADCRRMAQRMSAQDKVALLRMAEVWERQAQEADKRVRTDGKS
jgi:phytoene/squalene synthetase